MLPPSLRPRAVALAQKRAVRRLVGLKVPLFCGAGRVGVVALTFDDGPGSYTGRLLRTLRRMHAPATFFLVGNRLAEWPGVAAREAAFAAVGDHTWSHPHLPRLRYAAAAWEIAAARHSIEAALHSDVILFRPPYGQMTRRLSRLVTRFGMLDVRWSVDSRDDVPGVTATSVLRTVEETVRPGSIVLMHDLHPWTGTAVRRLLLFLERRGLQPVTVPELLRLDPPSIRQLQGDAVRHGCGPVAQVG